MSVQDSLFRRASFLLDMINGTRRNLYTVFGYSQNPGFDERFFKYMRQDIAARVVDAPAAALWTNPPLLEASIPEWNVAWDDLVARHDLFAMLERCDKLAGIGRFSILVFGFNDGGDLSKPLNVQRLRQNDNKILFLQPYSERSVKIETFVTDSSNPRFMRPEMYLIQPDLEKSFGLTAGQKASNLGSFKVHASRVLHIAENVLENDIFGSPRLERVYNILDDILKVTGGTAETFWLTSNRGMHIDVDKDMEMDPSDEANLTDEIEEYSDGLRRFIRTRGVKVASLGAETPDPRGAFEILISMLSGATGIPKRILIGSEAGQLASEQDRANWADRIEERRLNWANPSVLHPLIRMLSAAEYLPVASELNIVIDWPSAFKMSPLESAQTSAQHARSATNFAKTFETMEKLRRGEPGQEVQLDEEGNPIPGTGKEAVEGVEIDDLVTIEEARKMIGLDRPKITFDSGEDVKTNLRKSFQKVIKVHKDDRF